MNQRVPLNKVNMHIQVNLVPNWKYQIYPQIGLHGSFASKVEKETLKMYYQVEKSFLLLKATWH
jgi:hypothetical protein